MHDLGGGINPDLWSVSALVTEPPVPVATTPASERGGRISPDGHWIAYVSNEAGRPDVYLQEFPKPQTKRPISVKGGSAPQWRRDGREMYYLDSDGNLFAVPIATSPQLEIGVPKALFPTKLPSNRRNEYAVASNGQRFLISVPMSEPVSGGYHVVTNWRAHSK